MQIGFGEYLIISSCIKNPYNFLKINELIKEFKTMDVTFGDVNFLKINPKEVNYHKVWEGICDFTSPFSFELLTQFVLSTLDLRFNNGIPARLQVMFLDELSYEVSLIFNYTQLIEEEIDFPVRNKQLEFIESIAITFFEKLLPLYGTYGIERGVEGIENLLENQILPNDKVYFNKKLISNSITLLELIKGAKFSKKNGGGVYFRNSDLEDFQYEDVEFRININEIIKSL